MSDIQKSRKRGPVETGFWRLVFEKNHRKEGKKTQSLRLRPFQIFARFFRQSIWIYRPVFIRTALFMVGTALITAVLTRTLQPIFDDIFLARSNAKLWSLSLFVLLLFIAKGICGFGEVRGLAFLHQRIVADFQLRLLKSLIYQDYAFVRKKTSGKLLALFTYDMGLLANAMKQTMTTMGRHVLSLLAMVATMFWIDTHLALFGCIFSAAGLVPLFILGRLTRRFAGDVQQSVGRLTGFLQQVFQGITLIKAYGIEAAQIQQGEKSIDEAFGLSLRRYFLRALSHPLTETLGGMGVAAVIAYSGLQVIEGARTPGAFISFVMAFGFSYEPLKRMVYLNTYFQEGLAALDRLYTILDRPSQDRLENGQSDWYASQGAVSLRDLTFTYPSGFQALNALTLEIKPHHHTVLVGPSGAGKSTFFHLLLGLEHAPKGCIFIDGADITTIAPACLRASMALVSQDNLLFSDTIEANIRYGNPKASFAEIEAAARAVGALDFIEKLGGFQHVLAERGNNLSGGQKQRLSLARAFVRKASLLLLDEVSAALDPVAEETIYKALAHYPGTIVSITHRLSAARKADYVYVLDQGRVCESGDPQTLLTQKSAFTDLFKTRETLVSQNASNRQEKDEDITLSLTAEEAENLYNTQDQRKIKNTDISGPASPDNATWMP